jgi:hypothetical protein
LQAVGEPGAQDIIRATCKEECQREEEGAGEQDKPDFFGRNKFLMRQMINSRRSSESEKGHCPIPAAIPSAQ